jgi:hypothetical protein
MNETRRPLRPDGFFRPRLHYDGGTAPGPRVKRVLSFDLIKNVRFTSTCALMHMFFGRRGYSFFLAQQFDQRREVV